MASAKKSADGSIELTLKDGSVHGGFDCLLWAIGRDISSNTAQLNLDAAGVDVDRKGATDAM